MDGPCPADGDEKSRTFSPREIGAGLAFDPSPAGRAKKARTVGPQENRNTSPARRLERSDKVRVVPFAKNEPIPSAGVGWWSPERVGCGCRCSAVRCGGIPAMHFRTGAGFGVPGRTRVSNFRKTNSSVRKRGGRSGSEASRNGTRGNMGNGPRAGGLGWRMRHSPATVRRRADLQA